MYLLDANVFISAKNSHYGLDFVPAFWDWIVQQSTASLVCSLMPVYRELEAGADELSAWARAHRGLFLEVDADVAPSFQTVSSWVASSAYTPAARSVFLGNADFQLVAFAHAHGHTLVTHERSEPNSYKRIKIPDACAALGVAVTTPFDMLRRSGASFVLPVS